MLAMGSVLYEMATGKRAFEGNSTTSVIAAILERNPTPISAVRPLFPRVLDSVVKICLEKDPDERWQSVRDLRTNLKWIAEGDGAGTTSAIQRNPWRERAAWMLALALLSSLAFFAAGHNRPSSASESASAPAQFPVYPPERTVFSGPPHITVPVPQFALAPDGSGLAFVANASGADPVIWLRSIDQVTPRPLPGTEHAQLPFWSPDSQSVAFLPTES